MKEIHLPLFKSFIHNYKENFLKPLHFFNWRGDTKGRILIQMYKFMNSVKIKNTDLINSDMDRVTLQRLEKDEFTISKCEYTAQICTYRIISGVVQIQVVHK